MRHADDVTFQEPKPLQEATIDHARGTRSVASDNEMSQMIQRARRCRLRALRGLRPFAHDTRGHALVEYALLLAIVVAGGTVAYLVAGAGANEAFEVAGQFLGPSDGSQPRRFGEPAPESDSAVTDSASSNGSPSKPVETGGISLGTVAIVAWIAVVAAGLLVRRFLRPKARPRDDSDETVAAATTPDMLARLLDKRQQIRRLLSRGLEDAAAQEVEVQHLMSKALVAIAPSTPLDEVVTTMTDRRIRHLLVCHHGRQLLGIISDRDIKERSGNAAEDIMTRDPMTVAPDAPVAPAITLMLTKSISCLPVVTSEGELFGILTTTDLMLSLQCTLQVLTSIAAGIGLPAQSPQPAGSRAANVSSPVDEEACLAGAAGAAPSL
ncbi:MAG: CBS domain-containing protein [Planctomycetes bacterium]|nr:CBS domain-containing protein [Planctomycetota bacterium]